METIKAPDKGFVMQTMETRGWDLIVHPKMGINWLQGLISGKYGCVS